MAFQSILTPQEFSRHRTAAWKVVDCRFSLADPEAGRSAYGVDRIPGAFYAHLDEHLSAPHRPGVTGRHPLPERADIRALLGSWGLRPGDQLVAYDDGPGAIAARLWWLARYCGHGDVAVLDGGFAAWRTDGHEIETGPPRAQAAGGAGDRTPGPSDGPYPESSSLSRLAWPGDAAWEQSTHAGALVDARAPERYRGEVEPIDPVAGHIPGAQSAPFRDNLGETGRFRPAGELRERFEQIGPAELQIHYCGSGVTAAHNLLAMEVAGLSGAQLYPGSWSHWITDPERPVATGE